MPWSNRMTVIVILALTACMAGPPTQPTPAIAPSLTSEPERPTSQATAEPKVAPLLTQQAITTSLATATPGRAQRPTATFVPIPSAEEQQRQFLELLHTNGGCRLPCWWGITPGQTTIDTVKSQTNGAVNGTGGADVNGLVVVVNFTWGDSDDPVAPISYLKVGYYVSTATFQEYQENPFYAQPMYPSLPFLLSTYGPPAGAYINYDIGIRAMGMGSDLYFLILDYSNAGWLATYTMELARKDNSYIGCLNRASTTLELWSPQDADMVRLHPSLAGTGLKTIEQATSMTLAEFYERFKDPATDACLKSPVDLYQ
jgi:hypothetical protein